MSYLTGVDIGTYEAKGVLSDAEGVVLANSAHGHDIVVPRPGWAGHQADWWLGLTHVSRAPVAEAGVAPRDVAGVALSAIGPCMLPVDAGGRALTNAVLFGVDSRAAGEVSSLTDAIGEVTQIGRCGNGLTSRSVGPKILWLKNARPAVFATAAAFVTAATYLVERLTGERVIDHYIAAGFTPLYDLVAQCWTTDLADFVDPGRLPRLAWTAEVVGGVGAAAAAATGLASGTPVTTGTIDAAAEALSVGVAGRAI